MSGLVWRVSIITYKLDCCGLPRKRPIFGVTRQGKQCVDDGGDGRMSRRVRRYGVDYFGLPWRRRLIQQYLAGSFTWLQ